MSPRTGVLIFEGGPAQSALLRPRPDAPRSRSVAPPSPPGAPPSPPSSSPDAAGAPPADLAALPGDPERLLACVRFWTALDTAGKFLERPGADVVVVATDSPALGAAAMAVGAEVETTGPDFRFGRVLAGLVSRFGLDRVIYLGGGSAPLLTPAEIDRLLAAIARGGRVFVANNVQSPDVVGLGSTEAVSGLAHLETDNATLFALADAGYQRLLLPETATAGFDLDTPSDVLFLAHEARRQERRGAAGQDSGLGPRLGAGLAGLALDISTLERATAVLARGDYPSVTLIGRVAGTTVSYVNSNLLVRLRVYSEERGMKALGRIDQGLVRSLLAAVARDSGVDYLVREIASLSEAVFWDTRVVTAALGRWPDDADRFQADLGRWDRVKDPELARLVRAAAQADCPFVLGGHSVVAGGLRLLVRGIVEDKLQPGNLPEDG